MSPSQYRLIRLAGLGVCCTLLLLRTLLLLQSGVFVRSMLHAYWLLPMASFVVALCLATSKTKRTRSRQMEYLLLQSVSVLALGFTMGKQGAANYLGSLLLVVTVQIMLDFPTRVALPWILAQACVLAVSYVVADGTDYITGAVSVVFKMFTYAIVLALKREADARAQFSELNAEMMATREVYAERSRSHERLRISRDLHDVLGHRLTALSLNLEIARHKAKATAGLDEIERALSVTRDLLSEVRGVVSATRPTNSIDLCAALENVASGFAPIRVHLQVPQQLRTCDASRGEVLVRCAQELVTNAVKHARAQEVWICMEMRPNQMLHLSSHDDGMRWPAEEPREAAPGSGTGLIAMQERFEHFGGCVVTTRDPEEGFVVQGFLPMMSKAA